MPVSRRGVSILPLLAAVCTAPSGVGAVPLALGAVATAATWTFGAPFADARQEDGPDDFGDDDDDDDVEDPDDADFDDPADVDFDDPAEADFDDFDDPDEPDDDVGGDDPGDADESNDDGGDDDAGESDDESGEDDDDAAGAATTSGSGAGDDDDGDDDDDDFGGDDDDDDGDFDEQSLFEEDIDFDDEGYPVSRTQIIAFDADAQTLLVAENLGFRLIEQRDLPAVEAAIYRLEVPAEFASPRQAIDALEAAIPAAPFDLNYLYLLPEAGTNAAAGDDFVLGAAAAGTNVRIGVIDTVPDLTHPSLSGKAIAYQDFAKPGGRNTSHATAVVSIIVGEDAAQGYSGLLPGASVFAANIFHVNSKDEPETDAFAMISALDWLASQDVGVINLSLAGPASEVLEGMLDRLRARGHVVVAAVGNDGPAAPPLFPAAYDGIVGVTAIDLQDRPYRRAGRGKHVDLAAPGVRVRAAAGGSAGYASFTGTSFATPVASAIIALDVPVRQSQAGAPPVPDVRDLGVPGRDGIFGAGLVQTRRR